MRVTAILTAVVFAAACSTETPAPQLPPDSGVGDGAPADDAAPADTDGGPGADDAAPGNTDAGPNGLDALPGDALTGDARPDSGILDQCNPVTQDCLDMADKCRIESTMMGQGTQCVPRGANDVAAGAVCLGANCEAGLVCVNTGTVARCRTACDRTSGAGCSALGADFDCRIQLIGTNWGVCDELPPICDPLTLAPCEMTEACQPVRRFDGSFQFRCRSPGAGDEGQRCETAGCMRGLVCVREEMVSLCRRPCTAAGAACPAMQQCVGSVLNVAYCR